MITEAQGYTHVYHIATPTGAALGNPWIGVRQPFVGHDYVLDYVICSDPMYAATAAPLPAAYNGTMRVEIIKGDGETYQSNAIEGTLIGGLGVMDYQLNVFAAGSLQQTTRPLILPPRREILFEQREQIVVRISAHDVAAAVFLPMRVVLVGRMIPREDDL